MLKWVPRRINSVLHVTVSKEADILFSGNAGLIPSEGGIEARGLLPVGWGSGGKPLPLRLERPLLLARRLIRI